MKKNSTKFFAVVLVIAMLATQFVAPVFATETGATEPEIYCSDCGILGAFDPNQADDPETPANEAPRVVKTCKATYTIYNCTNPNVDPDAEVPVPCEGTITIVSEGTNEHKADGVVVEAVAPDCTTAGNVKYQGCKTCDLKLNVPAEGEELVVLESIVDPATGHDLEDVPQEDNACLTDGLKAHTKCKVCGGLFAVDAEGKPEDPTIVPEVIPGHDHDFSVKHDPVPANCRDKGYTEYYTCSICEKEDPTRPKTETPVVDHGFGIVYDERTYPATCGKEGNNHFECNGGVECPYSVENGGADEVLTALDHVFTDVAAVAPTCYKPGNVAYKTCSRECCEGKIYAADAAVDVAIEDALEEGAEVIAKLEHTKVAVNFKEATCTETGLQDAIICDREGCGFIHYAGDVTDALGHDLSDITPANAPDCVNPGNVAYKTCARCELNFAETTENDDLDAVALETVVVAAEGHQFKETVQDETCTEIGYKIYTCEKLCKLEGYIYSEIIPAAGHDFEAVAKLEPVCGVKGMEAHNKCLGCELLFAVDADPTDITIEAVDAADLEIAALKHVPVKVDFEMPTYDRPGRAEGTECDLCGEHLSGAYVIPELQEGIKFHFDIKAVNGSSVAVNSGYIIVDIYFDVVKAANDVYEESDVLANIFAIDVPFEFNNKAFVLETVDVGGAFDFSAYTKIADANAAGKVIITQDMGTENARVFRGEDIHVATLKFQVKDSAAADTYNFNFDAIAAENENEDNGVVAGASDEIIDITGSVTAVTLTVKKLGDANGDGDLKSTDTKKISDYIKTANQDTAYIAEYDLNKDGVINFQDLALLRAAVTGDTAYLAAVKIP